MIGKNYETQLLRRSTLALLIVLAAGVSSSAIAATAGVVENMPDPALDDPFASPSTYDDSGETSIDSVAASLSAEAQPAPLTGGESALPTATTFDVASPASPTAIGATPAEQQAQGGPNVGADVPAGGANNANAQAQRSAGGAQADVIPAGLLSDDPARPADGLLAKPETTPVNNRDSMDNLDLVLGQRQAFSDLVSLQDRITSDQRPVANVVGRVSSQSDDLDIYWAEASQDIFFYDGRGRIRPGVQFLRYDPKIGDRIDQRALGADGSYRFSDLAAVTGDFWVNRLMPKNAPDKTILTYDVYATLWPSDLIRIDLDTRRELFDNIRSLQLHLTARTVGGSIDVTPTNRTRLTIRTSGSWYSDDNQRWTIEGEALQRVSSRPMLDVGLRVTRFHFSKLLNDGYFNPKTYESGEAMFRLQTALSKALNVELAGSGGIEHANPGGSKPLFKASLQASYVIMKNWTLDGGLSYFSSRQSNSSGFARTTGTIGLHYRFK